MQLTQEQVRCKNHIIEIAIKYYETENKFKCINESDVEKSMADYEEMQKQIVELNRAINLGKNFYGKEFTDRCLEIAKSLLFDDIDSE